jgi:hypothetical protein
MKRRRASFPRTRPKYPGSVRYAFWSGEETKSGFAKMVEADPHVAEGLKPPALMAEVTVGRQTAGLLAVWFVGEKGLAVYPMSMTTREAPEFWMNDTYGSDLDAICLWLACELTGLAFDPIYEELLLLRKQDRRTIREALAARHGWNCHICGRPIPVRLRTAEYDGRHPDPLFPDVEHVVPRAMGGLHYYGNLRLGHRTCNLAKGSSSRPPRLSLLSIQRRGELVFSTRRMRESQFKRD